MDIDTEILSQKQLDRILAVIQRLPGNQSHLLIAAPDLQNMKISSHSPSFLCSGLLTTMLPLLAHADENLFGTVRGSETLPSGHVDLYQTTTLRTGKDGGHYAGWDFDTEVEYGVSDTFQMSLEVKQHAFSISGNEELRNDDFYRFGGLEFAGKYRFNSVFKDGYGLTLRPEVGWLRYDDVGGIIQQEIFVATSLIYQKNFLDDTLIFAANAGVEFAWGKKPAEEYDHEVSFEGGLGLTYRFAPNWFAGVEARGRSEFPDFDLGNHEHTVVFVGPALHYASQAWWATLQYGYQVWGNGVDEASGHTFAEESRHELRLKLGFSF